MTALSESGEVKLNTNRLLYLINQHCIVRISRYQQGTLLN